MVMGLFSKLRVTQLFTWSMSVSPRKVISVRASQSFSAFATQSVTLAGTVNWVRGHSSNTECPMDVTPSGIVTAVNPHELKAWDSIVVTLSGIWMLVRLVHSQNIHCGITVRFLDRVTLLKSRQPLSLIHI